MTASGFPRKTFPGSSIPASPPRGSGWAPGSASPSATRSSRTIAAGSMSRARSGRARLSLYAYPPTWTKSWAFPDTILETPILKRCFAFGAMLCARTSYGVRLEDAREEPDPPRRGVELLERPVRPSRPPSGHQPLGQDRSSFVLESRSGQDDLCEGRQDRLRRVLVRR